MARKAVYSLVTLFLLLSIFIYFGSQDAETIDDQGLSALIESVPESENGFRHIAFTQDEGYETFSSSCDKEKLQRHLDQEHWPVKWDEDLFLKKKVQISQEFIESLWDDKWVKDLLERQKEIIQLTIIASQAKRFDLNLNHQTFIDVDYTSMVNIGKILILKSMQHARDNEIEEAVEVSNSAIRFGQLIKTEASDFLISFMIGERIQQEALSWQAQLFQELNVSKHSYQSALDILDEVATKADYHYSRVAIGEYLYSRDAIQGLHNEPLMERLRLFFAPTEDEFSDSTIISNSFDQEDVPLIESTIGFLFATFPDFYYHKNKETNAYGKHLYAVRQSALEGCQNTPEITFEQSLPEYKIIDLFTPNAIGIRSRFASNNPFPNYQLRHCLNRLQVEANKLILAANWARNNSCERFKGLDDLQKYLGDTKAIDPFSGESLKLSKNGNEIYSVGKSGNATQDDEGALFSMECHYEEACYNRPRFSLYNFTID